MCKADWRGVLMLEWQAEARAEARAEAEQRQEQRQSRLRGNSKD